MSNYACLILLLTAFFDIQQDMSGIKDQLQDLGGMPFVTGQDYIRNMLFVGLDVQPMIIDPQVGVQQINYWVELVY